MKGGAALHGEPLRLKAAETCDLDVRAAQVKAKDPLRQVKGGRTGELRPVVGEDDIGELGFIAGWTHISAKSRERPTRAAGAPTYQSPVTPDDPALKAT